MCDLCDSNNDIKNSARQLEKHHADQFRRMVKLYEGLASGKIDPHGAELKEYRVTIKLLLKELVSWI